MVGLINPHSLKCSISFLLSELKEASLHHCILQIIRALMKSFLLQSGYREFCTLLPFSPLQGFSVAAGAWSIFARWGSWPPKGTAASPSWDPMLPRLPFPCPTRVLRTSQVFEGVGSPVCGCSTPDHNIQAGTSSRDAAHAAGCHTFRPGHCSVAFLWASRDFNVYFPTVTAS